MSVAAWYFTFRQARPITLPACEHALSTVGGPAVTDLGDFEGDPRECYLRRLSITAGDLVARLAQSALSPADPDPITTLEDVTLRREAPFASKLATYHALCAALAELGCVDTTLGARPAPIVDEAEAAGDTATATRLRAAITAALIADAPSWPAINLRSTRPDDLDAVLAAYVEPSQIRSVTMDDCALTALPAAFARFPNVESLWLNDNPLEGHAFRGVSLPKLTSLLVSHSRVRRLTRDDLAGFPMLGELVLHHSPLEALDPDIIEVCPALRRVVIVDTPLADDHALRARWPGVTWA